MDKSLMIEMAKALTEVAGVAGREHPAAEVAAKYLSPLGKVEISPLGSVYCKVCEGDENAPHIMLEAHLDRIGLVVAHHESNGFLRIGNVGGFDRRLLPAAPVTIHAESGDYAGVISSTPPHLSTGKEKPQEMEDFLVDTGFSTEKAKELFAPGDMITLDARFAELANDRICGGAMDDRIGCVAVIAAAQEIAKAKPNCTVTVLLAAQEETGGAGSGTATFHIKPDQAIAVDVSFGDGFGTKASKCGKLGEGTMIGVAPVLNRAMFKKLQAVAQEHDIAFQIEVMGGRTGTDSDNIATSGSGVRTALLSIPLRNMHTVVETADVNDVIATAKLMVAYVKEVAEK